MLSLALKTPFHPRVFFFLVHRPASLLDNNRLDFQFRTVPARILPLFAEELTALSRRTSSLFQRKRSSFVCLFPRRILAGAAENIQVCWRPKWNPGHVVPCSSPKVPCGCLDYASALHLHSGFKGSIRSIGRSQETKLCGDIYDPLPRLPVRNNVTSARDSCELE
ncbi:hypothetical protein L209DRAFT_469128 [Thermothelomyces heterothallicus CBS 203.75]